MPKPCGHIETHPECKVCHTCEDCSSEKARGHRKNWGVPEPDCSPGAVRKVFNFAKALVSHVAAGMPTASKEEQQRRISLCLVCPHYLPKNRACGLCGCFVNMKTQWADQTCPDNRW